MQNQNPFNNAQVHQEQSSPSYFRYEISVEGMSCIKCKSKVENLLTEMNMSISNIKVDFITNRILLSLINRKVIEEISIRLQGAGFKVKECKDISHTLLSNNRAITLRLLKGNQAAIINCLNAHDGNKICENEPAFSGNKCMITYDPVKIRGSEIIQKLEDLPEYKSGELKFTIENIFEDDIKQIKFSDFSLKQVIVVVLINIINLIISQIPEHMMYLPEGSGMFSYYFITVVLLTALNIYYIGYNVYITSIKQLIMSLNINMLTLVSVGSGLALIFGAIYTVIGLIQSLVFGVKDVCFFIMSAEHMFHTSATIILALVVGKYIEGKIKRKIYRKIDDLRNKLQVKTTSVTRVVPKNKSFAILSQEDLHPLLIEKDDYILVKKSSMVPFDGFVEKGSLKVVENIQYGWERIENKSKGHPIISGSQIIDAEESTVIRVTEPLERTLAGRLFHEIKEATSGSSSNAKNVDTLAIITKYFISIVILVALCTFIGWSIMEICHGHKSFRDINYSYPFEKAIAVLVASCPCALGIAIPMMYAIALRKGLKAGVLIKDVEQLDVLQTIDTVVFDKTGTITGTYNVKSVRNMTNKYNEHVLWQIVSEIEKEHLQHPVGLLLFQEAVQRTAEQDEEISSVAVRENAGETREYFLSEGIIHRGITIEGKEVQVALGNDKLLERLSLSNTKASSQGFIIDIKDKNTSRSQDCDTSVTQSPKNGKINNQTTIYLCIDREVQLKIVLSLQEDVKSNAFQLISQLKQFKKDVHILSGDSKSNVAAIGKQLGIPSGNILAEIDPEGKEKYIKYLTEECNKKVMMIGDGMNDIKAFKAATLSCSINFKSSQNLTHSDFIIVNNNLMTISNLFTLGNVSKNFKNIILACALIYNVPTILAASGALKVSMGIDLNANVACWAMVVFSLILTIVANLMELVDIKKSHASVANVIEVLRRFIAGRFSRNAHENKKPYADLEEVGADIEKAGV